MILSARADDMSDIAVRVEKLGKQYRLGERRPYKALRDTVSNALYAPLRAAVSWGNRRKGHQSTTAHSFSDLLFWALKDISFDIKKGEAVGIIGGNGAGKSTLLKILSRITRPTEGHARMRGRVGSLLEVGTGFHPELTGRENTYLNGAIIGMRKREIDEKFDEIVAFAEIQKFIDIPVKLYSSGMYVRLAFAVAAHLEPEILIVDEVLAVGDAAFQQKCLGKMGDVAKQGRTVLFVSHNLEAVRKLCTRAVLLEQGKLLIDGSFNSIISKYITPNSSCKTAFMLPAPSDKDVSAFATEISVEDLDAKPTNGFLVGRPWQVRVAFTVLRSVEHFIIAIGLMSERGIPVWTVWSKPCDLEPATYTAIFRNEQVCLCSGSYTIQVGLSVYERTVHYVEDAGVLRIAEVSDGAGGLRINGEAGFVLDGMSVVISQP